MLNVVANLCDFAVKCFDAVVLLVGIELEDASHADFPKFHDVVARNGTVELRFPRLDTLVDVSDSSVHVLGLLELFILIDAVFDEDFFKRSEELSLLCFVELNEKFLTKHLLSVVD